MFILIVPAGVQTFNKYQSITLKVYKGNEDKAPHFHSLNPARS